MFERYIADFKQQTISIKLYVLAIILFLAGLICVGKFNSDFIYIVYFSFILFEIGFVIWFYSFFKKYKKCQHLKKFGLLFHLFVLWLAHVYAGLIVGSALGLPASDFSYTVTFLTFFCYFPALFASLAIFGLLLYVGILIVYYFKSIFLQKKLWESFSIFHIIGFVLILYFFALTHDKLMSYYLYNGQTYVHHIAYYTDYQYMPVYLQQFPDIDKSIKIKLHANGVYSTIKENGNGYKLIVKKIE